MICEQALDLLCKLEDGTIRPGDEAALLAHLSGCESCRAEYTFRETLREQMASLQAKPPADFTKNVMARIGKETAKQKARKRWLGPVAALGAVAAMLALTIGTGLVKLPGRDAELAPAPAEEEKAEAENAFEDEAFFDADAPEEAEAFEPAEMLDGNQTMTAGTLPGTSTVESYGGWDDEGEDNAYIPMRQPDVLESGMLLPDDEAFCLQLSEREDAAVLAYSGLDAAFPAQLAKAAPELGALLDEAEVYEEDGRIVISTSIDTAMAIQEWLMLTLPDQPDTQPAFTAPLPSAQREDDAPKDEGVSPMLERITAFDPEGACLTTVVTVNPLLEPVRWPSEWPDNFAALFRIEKNWALYYPDEAYVPLHYDPAFLVLIPGPAAD